MNIYYYVSRLAAAAVLTTLVIASFSVPARADYVEDAEALEMSGDVDGARALLESARSQGEPEANLHLGRLAYRNYDFDGARRHYAAYARLKKKASAEGLELLAKSEEQLSLAENFLERVEKIAIIDSIAVPAENFFKAYRLPASAGFLLPPEDIPFADSRDHSTLAFSNENRDFMMWTVTDSVGETRLAESILLTDGTWSRPVVAPDELSEGGNADFPFMMADGITLYYASDGEGSMGGLDIFVATRDAATGEYLQPQNIGMPYNSPYDDYMLAIDELNGVGWWATDRNRLGDKVTVYVFMTNDLRKNYDTEELDTDDIMSFARIDDFRATQDEEDADKYKGVLRELKNIDTSVAKRRADFHFPLSGGREYTSLDDFPDQTSRTMMKKYIAAEKELVDASASLDSKRRKYHESRSKTLATEIAALERQTEQLAEKARKARSEVYRALAK